MLACGQIPRSRPSLDPGTIVSTQTTADGLAAATIEGEADVTRTGAATYRIPLWTPPGRNGIEPHLALSYGSEKSEGLVGVGWSLGGFSSIQRCARTIAQDGVALPVGFTDGTSGDRYCLDGMRLMLVSGAHGASGAEYRLESQAYTKVVIQSTDMLGPVVLKVYRKDGTIVTYGDSAGGTEGTTEGNRHAITAAPTDSGVVDTPQAVRLAWQMVRVEDRHGNYMRIVYGHANVGSTYESYPLRIEYTGFNSTTAPLSPDRTVELGYEPRTDVTEHYVAGFHNRRTVRLTTLTMLEGTEPWRWYHAALHDVVEHWAVVAPERRGMRPRRYLQTAHAARVDRRVEKFQPDPGRIVLGKLG